MNINVIVTLLKISLFDCSTVQVSLQCIVNHRPSLFNGILIEGKCFQVISLFHCVETATKRFLKVNEFSF